MMPQQHKGYEIKTPEIQISATQQARLDNIVATMQVNKGMVSVGYGDTPVPTFTQLPSDRGMEQQLTQTPVVIERDHYNVGLMYSGCLDCKEYSVKVRLTHYDPNEGSHNCWDYDESTGLCMSNMQSDLPWQAFWGVAAACPVEWPHGTWVMVPDVGNFICLDRGGIIGCSSDTCDVDILGNTGSWDGKIFDAQILVPGW
ncbi:MAG: hypothetical protein VB089_21355 [Anaerolineaceae bacterium]|nr:hypothetical protein [Anaerolineaceae bacterium]